MPISMAWFPIGMAVGIVGGTIRGSRRQWMETVECREGLSGADTAGRY